MSSAAYNLGGVLAIVTGGAHGIGKQLRATLASNGAKVTSIDIDDQPDIEENVSAVKCDTTDAKSLRSALKDISLPQGEFRRLWLFSLAGRALPEEFHQRPLIDPDLFARTTDINLNSHFNFIWSLEPLFSSSAIEKSVVLTSSINALVNAGLPGYSAAKAGLIGLTTSLAETLAVEWNATLNVAILGSVMASDKSRIEPKNFQILDNSTFRGSIMSEEEAANSLIWIAAAPRTVTAQAIVVDCGQTKKFVEYF
jgi:gluconate 5-dehydrogenase